MLSVELRLPAAGGCLYIGQVTVLNQDTGASFQFSTTSAPLTPEAAAGSAERHVSKVA